ncbi:putative bifunctional diguanylate cyclase/phosphodiesterase [Bacillus suaedaesalsae]|uniref:EAL domain-containing protein n=1 Tax=Bacillus suaedaesalsae TaxID=2810349 RepID=A0ABS2DDQ2_9BACI|nr:EAL domain-containing protein [Bacillus suaedaesalsae]MBM6616585.1 EAL domain-containing protein [Bacillus suaedaesalsae]
MLKLKNKLNSEIILFLILISLVFITTNFNLTFVYGISLTFSSIFLFVVLRIFGLRAAVIVGLISVLFVPREFLCVASSIINVIEIIFVGAFFLRGRKAKMFFVDVLFWLTLGAILLYVLNSVSLSGDALYFEVSKSIINGLFNVLIADMLLAYFPFYKFTKNNRLNKNNVSVHQFLSQITIFAILVPFFISVLSNTWNTHDTTSQEQIISAQMMVNRIERELIFWKKDDIQRLALNDVLQSNEVGELIQRHKIQESNIIILTNYNSVIASTLSDVRVRSTYEWQQNYTFKKVSTDYYEALPKESTHQPIIQWSQGQYIYSKQLDGIPIQVVIQFPTSKYQEQIFRVTIEQLKYLGLFSVITILLVMSVTRVLTKNLSSLTKVTTGLPEKLRTFEKIEWPQSTIAELRLISSNLREMADKLKELFTESIEMNSRLSNQKEKLQKSEDKLHQLAFYDSLTSLPNRHYFQNYVKDLIQLDENKKLAIIFLDLNQFKQINDTLGHDAGDALLQLTANNLSRLQHEKREVFRLGGDEFVIVHRVDHVDEVRETVDLVLKEFSTFFEINGQMLYITASVGVSMYPDDGTDLDTLVKFADIAMYISKEKGGNVAQFYNDTMRDKFQKRLVIENALRSVVDLGGFEQYYQPKTMTGKITSMEALLRWNDPILGFVSPGEFIPIAEEIGLILQIDEWSLIQACKQNKDWQNQGLQHVPISVNISAKHFQQDYLVTMVKKALDDTGLDPNYLKLEITESVFIKNPQHVADVIRKLKELGVHISIDDFGKGFSSLYQLLKLPMDEIKIDRQFIKDIDQHEKQQLLVKSIFEIAHNLKLNVVAEGVETEFERNLLAQMGCDEIQGYLFSPPVNREDMEKFLGKIEVHY